MLYDRMEEAFDDAFRRHEIAAMKIRAYTEANIDLLEINYAKAREKVFCEDGTAEDLIYLQEEANESAVAKLKAAIVKIVEAFKKFCNDVKLKVLSFVQSKDTKEKLDTAEKKIKLNPFLGKKKIQIDDTEKQFAVVKWANDQYRKLLSKIKSGRTVDREDVREIKDEASQKMRKAMGAAAVVTITIAGAIALVKKRSAKLEADMKEFTETVEGFSSQAKQIGLEEIDITGTTVLVDAVDAVSDINKNGLRSKISGVTDVFRSIFSGISGNKKAQESVEDDVTDETDDTVLESSISNMLDDIESDLFGESTDDSDDDDEFDDFDF